MNIGDKPILYLMIITFLGHFWAPGSDALPGLASRQPHFTPRARLVDVDPRLGDRRIRDPTTGGLLPRDFHGTIMA